MLRKAVKIFLFLGLLVVILVVYSNQVVHNASKNQTYYHPSEIKKNRVGLLLGTAKYYRGGGLNLYFKYRIEAAVALYNAGKIDFILISGDNSSMSYNEPITFKKELMKYGIPEDVIVLDFAGFRTLDSVIRAQAVFGQDELTIITQEFQNERAIYIAKKHGIQAVGFNARTGGSYNIRMRVREYFARTKAFLDVVFGKEPRFYGEKIEIGVSSSDE